MMVVILHCGRCGGNIRPFKRTGYRVCDIDGDNLTQDYRERIRENGCSLFTLRSIPRKESKFGNHPLGVSDAAYQNVILVPKGLGDQYTGKDNGTPYPYEYDSVEEL
jgi:hypothetical protein